MQFRLLFSTLRLWILPGARLDSVSPSMVHLLSVSVKLTITLELVSIPYELFQFCTHWSVNLKFSIL